MADTLRMRFLWCTAILVSPCDLLPMPSHLNSSDTWPPTWLFYKQRSTRCCGNGAATIDVANGLSKLLTIVFSRLTGESVSWLGSHGMRTLPSLLGTEEGAKIREATSRSCTWNNKSTIALCISSKISAKSCWVMLLLAFLSISLYKGNEREFHQVWAEA